MTTLPPEHRRLTGWKEIAAHLGKSTRTVQRYERDLGMPVIIKRTGVSRLIWADTEALDSWQRSPSASGGELGQSNAQAPAADPTPRSKPAVAGTVVATVCLCCLGVLGLLYFGTPASTASPWSVARQAPGALAVVLAGDEAVLVDLNLVTALDRVRAPRSFPFRILGKGQSVEGRSTLVVATARRPGMALLDLVNGRVTEWHALELGRLEGVMTTQDGKTAFYFDRTGMIKVRDLGTGATRDFGSVPGEVFDGALDERRRRLYVVSRDDAAVYVFDVDTGEWLRRIAMADGAYHMEITSDGRRGFVTNQRADVLTCLDLESFKPARVATVGRSPVRLALDPTERRVFVANRDSDSITVVNATTCRVVGTLENVTGGSRAGAVAISADGARLLVGAFDDAVVHVLDIQGASFRPLGRVALAERASEIIALGAVSTENRRDER